MKIRKSFISRNLIILTIILLFPLFAFCQQEKAKKVEETKEPYPVFIPADLEYGDMRIENFGKIIDELMKFAKDKIDVDLKVKIRGVSGIGKYKQNKEEIFKDLMKERGATVFGSPMAYIEAEERKIPIRPFLSIAIDGRNKFKYCLFVNKDSGIKSLAQLKNGKVNAFDNGTGSLYILREMLVENGQDVDIDKFLGKPVAFKNESYAFNSLIDDKIDCVYANIFSTQFALKAVYAPEFIVPLICSKEYTMLPFLASKPTTAEEGKEVKESLNFIKEIMNSPQAEKFSSILKGFGASFADVNEKDYDDWRALYKKAKKKGWQAGFDRWEKMVHDEISKAIEAGKLKKKK